MNNTFEIISHKIMIVRGTAGVSAPGTITEQTALPEALDEPRRQELVRSLEAEFDISLAGSKLPETVGELCDRITSLLKEKKRKAERIITVPNILSLFRLLLIPVYAFIYVHAETTREYLAAGAVLAVSCITDLFDGYIARNFDQVSNLGKVLDPIADKATQGVMLICLAKHHPTLWWLLGFFAVKEAFQLIMGCWYLRKGQMLPGALMSGKISTTVLFLCMIVLVVFPGLPVPAVFSLIGLCAVFMAISFFSYIKAYFGKNKKVRDL